MRMPGLCIDQRRWRSPSMAAAAPCAGISSSGGWLARIHSPTAGKVSMEYTHQTTKSIELQLVYAQPRRVVLLHTTAQEGNTR